VNSFTANNMPSPPLRYTLDDDNRAPFELTDFGATVAAAEATRQEAFDSSRKLQAALTKIRSCIGTGQATTQLHSLLRDLQGEQIQRGGGGGDSNRVPREANLSFRYEELVRLLAYQHFLQTGALLPPVEWTTDEEYLAGALMGLAQDLQLYGLGRATVRDVPSVQAAKDLVAEIQEFLMQLDFRNGPLRRKYDGTKYCLKALETLLYELAVTSPADVPEQKRLKKEEARKLLPSSELEALKLRMEHRDELRENLIKRCRDGQKAAKQAIFALHRGDRTRASQLLQSCRTCILEQLWPIAKEEPPLRTSGSFTGVLEEYVEAQLFAAFLYGEDISGAENGAPTGTLLKPEDFFVRDEMQLEPDEYIGGLCDLTGEIGRYAVQCGTARDVEQVKLCLVTNSDIHTALQSMERLPSGGVAKKMDVVRRSVEKIQRMLYEMSLSEAAGGRSVHSDVSMEHEESTKDDY
jgi:predicted translin family RNA/ssDNA-binding protein